MSNVALGADVVSAHGGIPVEQQVASTSQLLEKRHTFDRIAPGQSVRYEGTVMIPLSQARIIRNYLGNRTSNGRQSSFRFTSCRT